MAGYSTTNSNYNYLKSGFSNQLLFGYHPVKHFSVNAFYEFNSWATTDNSFGIAADFSLKKFYIGAEIKAAQLTASGTDINSTKYNLAPGAGLHIGFKQRIYKHLFANAQAGYSELFLKETISNANLIVGKVVYIQTSQMQTIDYFYFRIGISYRI